MAASMARRAAAPRAAATPSRQQQQRKQSSSRPSADGGGGDGGEALGLAEGSVLSGGPPPSPTTLATFALEADDADGSGDGSSPMDSQGADGSSRTSMTAHNVESLMWVHVTPKGIPPTVRVGSTIHVARNYLYMFGGMGGSGGAGSGGRSSLLFRVPMDGGMWEAVHAKGPIPRPRSGHTANLVNGELWVYGGEGEYTGLNKRDTFSDMFAYNPAINMWRPVEMIGGPPYNLLPPARRAHTATLIGTAKKQRLVVFGGRGPDRMFSTDVLFNDLQVMDVMTHIWVEITPPNAPPSPRCYHSATYVPDLGRILYFGGLSSAMVPTMHGPRALPVSTDHSTNLVYAPDVIHVLDVESWCWSVCTPAGSGPGPVFGHTAAMHPTSALHTMFVCGGRRETRSESNLFLLDVDHMTWTNPIIRGQDPGARFGHAMTVSDSAFIIFGGSYENAYTEHSLCTLLIPVPHFVEEELIAKAQATRVVRLTSPSPIRGQLTNTVVNHIPPPKRPPITKARAATPNPAATPNTSAARSTMPARPKTASAVRPAGSTVQLASFATLPTVDGVPIVSTAATPASPKVRPATAGSTRSVRSVARPIPAPIQVSDLPDTETSRDPDPGIRAVLERGLGLDKEVFLMPLPSPLRTLPPHWHPNGFPVRYSTVLHLPGSVVATPKSAGRAGWLDRSKSVSSIPGLRGSDSTDQLSIPLTPEMRHTLSMRRLTESQLTNRSARSTQSLRTVG